MTDFIKGTSDNLISEKKCDERCNEIVDEKLINDDLINNFFDDEDIDENTKSLFKNMDKKSLQEYILNMYNPPKLNPLLEELYIKAEETIMPMYISKPALFIKVKIFDKEVEMLLDTGAQTNVIDFELAKDLGIDEYIDKSRQIMMLGVGQNMSIGEIPYLELDIEGNIFPACFTVLNMPKEKKECGGCRAIIGLSFMMYYHTQLDFVSRKLKIMDRETNFIIKDH